MCWRRFEQPADEIGEQGLVRAAQERDHLRLSIAGA